PPRFVGEAVGALRCSAPHTGESRYPVSNFALRAGWIPAYAGMTTELFFPPNPSTRAKAWVRNNPSARPGSRNQDQDQSKRMAFASWPIAKAGALERFYRYEYHRAAREGAGHSARQEAESARVRARRHAPRQRQGGRR